MGDPAKFLLSLAVALFATSCFVPPTCFSRHRGAATRRNGHLVTVVVRSDFDPRKRTERGAAVIVDAAGGMSVSGLDFWPRRCVAISPEDLAEISRSWQPVLERIVGPQAAFRLMARPYAGDTSQADEPVLSITFGSASERSVQVVWDGERSLPPVLDTAVLRTLEVLCSNSRLARRYLLAGLPRSMAERLECSPK